MPLADRLAAAYPGAQWTLLGETLTWHGPGAAPSADALAALRVAPDPPPRSISPRQWMSGLWHAGAIAYDQHLAFLETRAIPAPLQAILDAGLADDDTGAPTPRKLAVSLIKGAGLIERANPLTELVRVAQGWSADHLDDLWRAWAAL